MIKKKKNINKNKNKEYNYNDKEKRKVWENKNTRHNRQTFYTFGQKENAICTEFLLRRMIFNRRKNFEITARGGGFAKFPENNNYIYIKKKKKKKKEKESLDIIFLKN